ncbi:MAG: RNA polymerase sigma factor [Planctomycetota bacterium]
MRRLLRLMGGDASETPFEQDVQLARDAAAQKPGAIDKLTDRLACVPTMIRAIARRSSISFHAGEVDDMAQNTLIAVWQRLDSFEGRAPLEQWVLGFARFEIRNGLRRRDRDRRLQTEEVTEAPQEQPSGMSSDAYVLLLEKVEELTPPAPEIVRLYALDGVKFDVIGRRLGMPGNTAKTIYHRSLSRLRAKLPADFWEELA